MIKRFVKKLLYGYRSNSDTYIEHLKSIGCKIGKRVTIYDPRQTIIDETRPCLITIGDDVKITSGVKILTHGFDWSVLAAKHNIVLGSAGNVKIGNNVFIGMNSIILKGVTIGNNVIIGAGSIVNKDVPDNSVVAGNPAKFITSVEDYYKKRLDAQVVEATELYVSYVKRFNTEPPVEVFDEFFFLFTQKDDVLPEKFKKKLSLYDKYDLAYNNLISKEPRFKGFDDFKNYAKDFIIN